MVGRVRHRLSTVHAHGDHTARSAVGNYSCLSHHKYGSAAGLVAGAPIDLELERLNAEFRLFALRRHVAFGSLRFRPDWVALPHRDIVAHPSLHAIPTFRRLTRPQALVRFGLEWSRFSQTALTPAAQREQPTSPLT
ncbi:hypothetical protein MTO96_030071 [Rhipicephalus appendiculatus]